MSSTEGMVNQATDVATHMSNATVNMFKSLATDEFTIPPRRFPEATYIGLIVLMFELSRFVVDPLWAKLGRYLGAPNEGKVFKFQVQMTNLVVHTISTLFLYDVLTEERWFEDVSLVWINFPNQFQPPHYLAFYCFSCGYHLQRLVRVLCEERKEDFFEMLLHHAVTVFLLACSFHLGYIRVGLMVLYVHDSSDILGCLAKVWNYCGWKKVAILFFLPMMYFWFYTRLFLLPLKIIPMCFYHHNHDGYFVPKWCCLISLCILVGLHAYWFSLFLQMLRSLVHHSGKLKAVDDFQETKSKSA